MITSFRSPSETGVYSLIYNVGLVSQVFTNAFDNAWLPWFQKKVTGGNQYKTINENANYLMIIVAWIVVSIILAAPEIIKFLAPQEYWYGIPMSVPIILATYIMFLYTLEVHTEYCYKKTKQIPFYTIIAAFSNLVLNYLLIPKFGAIAAAYTTLISYLISFGLHYYAAHKCNKDILPFNVFVYPTIFILLASMIMLLCIANWIIRWCIICIVAVFYIVYILKVDLLHKMMRD